jgi:hypothetical protein
LCAEAEERTEEKRLCWPEEKHGRAMTSMVKEKKSYSTMKHRNLYSIL